MTPTRRLPSFPPVWRLLGGDMRGAGVLLFLLVAAAASPALAQCPAALQFEVRFSPSEHPPRAKLREPITYATLGQFLADIEQYRDLAIEGFNRRLLRFGEDLNALDQSRLTLAQSGACGEPEQSALLAATSSEFRKIGRDYADIYHDAMAIYYIDIRTYRDRMWECANGNADC